MAFLPRRVGEFDFPVAGKIRIEVKTWSSVASTLVVEGTTLQAPFRHEHAMDADRAADDSNFILEDMPVSLSVGLAAGATITRRQTYVSIGFRIAGSGIMGMIRGYLDPGQPLNWPPGKFEPMFSGKGAIRSITGTDPAAQAEISETVPANAIWRVRSIKFTLVKTAGASDSAVQLVIDDGTNDLWDSRVHDLQQAGETRSYNFAEEGPAFHATEDAASELHQRLPKIILDQGYKIKTSTTNKAAADNYGAPQLQVEEWLEE